MIKYKEQFKSTNNPIKFLKRPLPFKQGFRTSKSQQRQLTQKQIPMIGSKPFPLHISLKKVPIKSQQIILNPQHWGCILPKQYQRRKYRKNYKTLKSQEKYLARSQIMLIKYLQRKQKKTSEKVIISKKNLKLTPSMTTSKKIFSNNFTINSQEIQQPPQFTYAKSQIIEQNKYKTLQGRIRWKNRMIECIQNGLKQIQYGSIDNLSWH